MSHSVRAALIALTAFVEFAVLVQLAFGLWLFTGWFIDEETAMRMTDADWYALGGRRLAGVALIAAVSGAIVYGVNRLVAYVTGDRASRVPRWSALAFAGILLLAGLAAVVQFVIRKPYWW